MSEEQGKFVLPTPVAVQRYQQMKVESILNTEYQVTDEKTPFEFFLRGDMNASAVIELLGLAEGQAEIATDLLEDAKAGGSLEEIYGLRGGVLNILMPPLSDDNDHGFLALDEDDDAAQATFANTAHELFAAMTPGQVWAGTGKHEMALADAYLPFLWKEMGDREFPTTGAANTEWLSRLRLWTYNPAPGYNGRVIDVVTFERSENYRKRLELARDLEIDIDFSFPDL